MSRNLRDLFTRQLSFLTSNRELRGLRPPCRKSACRSRRSGKFPNTFSPTYPLFFRRPSQLPRETCLAIAKPAVLEVSKPGKQRGLRSQAEYLPARLMANIHQELTAKEVAAFVAEQRAKDPVFAQAWAKFVAEKDGSEEKAKESAGQIIRSYVRSQHHLTPPKPEPPPPPKVYLQTLTENKSLFFRQHFCPDGQPLKQFLQRELCRPGGPAELWIRCQDPSGSGKRRAEEHDARRGPGGSLQSHLPEPQVLCSPPHSTRTTSGSG